MMSDTTRQTPFGVSLESTPASAQPLTELPLNPVDKDPPVALYSAPERPPKRPKRKPVRVPHFSRMKRKKRRITAVTCYDATFARLVDDAGIDLVLVGDSLGNVIQGQDSTLPVTLDDILYHCRAVRRGLRYAHLVADMPFMTYHSPEVALPNAARLMAEGGAHAVKLEGGERARPVVEALVAQGVPVLGHIGLTPQSVHALGGHRIQGKGVEARERVMRDALALEQAGCYAIVLEGIPAELATEVSAALHIPTIGIGAGAGCDGQILVLYDMLGLNPDFQPKFLKRFANMGDGVRGALETYAEEVKAGTFPAKEHCYTDPSTDKAALQVARG